MERQVKPTGAVLEAQVQPNTVKLPAAEPLWLPDLLLRTVVVALTAAAAVVMGAARETKMVPVTVVSTLPPMPVAVLAKSTYSSAFTYFIVANAFACACTAVSLTITVRNRGASTKKTLSLLVSITDVIVVALLFSGGGAAAAIGMVGAKGNPHVRWNKICGVFSRFCAFTAASIVTSHAAAALHVTVVALSVLNLHRRSL